MAVLKCKMCGGDIIAAEGQTYGVCDSCGSTVTLPNINDQRMENLFNRANHFRMVSEFDKAVTTYEMILNEDNSNAEAHWGLLLSRYGIEYVEDPVSHERIPTCHRIQNESILSDGDYLAAIEYAPDGYTRSLYEAEGKRLSELQRGLLQVSAQTEPFDVFICYKESTEGGSRTKDSALAQDIYYQLTGDGYKVFFSRITLEDKLGKQYEPYIFAALNSAKVMLAIGTKPEYFTAVWVKNEWSRFLALARKDRSKLLIPCYRDMNVYDLPDELSMLQSQDMSKIGFMQDLLRGIEKVIRNQKIEEKPRPVQTAAAPGVESLYKRATLFLEDGDFAQADEYFDRILDIDPEYAPAYIGKLCVSRQVRVEGDLEKCEKPLGNDSNYQKAIRFADAQQKAIYEKYHDAICKRIKLAQQESIYKNACEQMKNVSKVHAQQTISDDSSEYVRKFINIAKIFLSISDYRDARGLAQKCLDEAEIIRNKLYNEAIDAIKNAGKKSCLWEIAQCKLNNSVLDDYCNIDELRKRTEKRYVKCLTAENERKKTIVLFVALFTLIACVAALVITRVIIPRKNYYEAVKLRANGKWEKAVVVFRELDNYSDAATQITETYYQHAQACMTSGDYVQAYQLLAKVKGYKDVDSLLANDENLAAARDAMFTVGNYVTFGTYPQTKSGNDETPIEWLVLDCDGDNALLLSRYGLDAQPYNEEYEDIRWEKCTLRSWLNDDFMNRAFAEDEQVAILLTNVDNSRGQGYSKWSTSGGNNTQDKIFLLSYAEANKYLSVTYDDSDNIKSRVAPTAYAKAQGASTSNSCETADGEAAGWWCLRSPGYFQSYASSVSSVGFLNNSNVHDDYNCVRPALWVNLESGIF